MITNEEKTKEVTDKEEVKKMEQKKCENIQENDENKKEAIIKDNGKIED